MKKAISTDQTPERIAAVLRMLAESPRRFTALIGGLSAEGLAQPLGPGERTPIEVLAHVLHCEALTATAISAALLLKEPVILKIHPERDFGRLYRYDLQPAAELLVYFSFRRRVLLRTLDALTDAQWSRTVREEGKQRQESVYWQARGQALHEDEHLNDLADRLVAHPYR